MTRETVFDLASLTKPLATACVAMKMTDQGLLNPKSTIGDLAPDMAAGGKGRITVEQLLCHTSGLADWRPYYEEMERHPPGQRRTVLEKLLSREEPLEPPGKATLYSDLDFLMLQVVLERLSGLSLDQLARRLVFDPLGIRDLFFLPLHSAAAPSRKRNFAATEDCPRRGLLEGRVHDDNAFALGGVAGHAGLFGTARAVFNLLSELQALYKGAGTSGWVARETIRQFLAPVPGRRFTLGFDTPEPPNSSSGRYFSPNSVGHLGFTGTSFWMDLDRGLLVVLLTNRVHLGRENILIRQFRPLIHNAAMEWMGCGKS